MLAISINLSTLQVIIKSYLSKKLQIVSSKLIDVSPSSKPGVTNAIFFRNAKYLLLSSADLK